MATVKLGQLVIRTVAKPISAQLKHQATQHPRFREFCVGLAQRLYRAEVKLRTKLLGEPAKHVRPLSETRAIENGANALAEGFLFGVTAMLIIGETWRSSRNQSRQRDDVNDRLDDLGTRLEEISTSLDGFAQAWEDRLQAEKLRNDELQTVLEKVVEIGLRSGWAEFRDTPLQFPQVQLQPRLDKKDPPKHHNSEQASGGQRI